MNWLRYHRIIFACLLLLLLSPPANCQDVALRLLVPAYGNPGDTDGLAMWEQLIETAEQVGPQLIVILNPINGPGHSQIDPNYIGAHGDPLIRLRDAGATVVGYVPTAWGCSPSPGVELDINYYYDLEGSNYWRGAGIQISGIFFDEMSDQVGCAPFLQGLGDYVRTLDPDALVIGNPGKLPAGSPTPGEIDAYVKSVDILVLFEDSGANVEAFTPPSWVFDYPAGRIALMVHTEAQESMMESDLALAIDRGAGVVYVTDDDESDGNPYNRIPSYWLREVEVAIGQIFADGFESGNTGAWFSSP